MRAQGTWHAGRRRIDVGLWHQAFASLPEEARLQTAFIFLDNLLGEDDVERWVGQIDLVDGAPADALEPAALKAEIDRHRVEPRGEEIWTLAKANRPDGTPAVVLANADLKRIDHPFADVHVTIAVLYGAERMPTDAEMTILDDEEEDLLRRLGDVAIFAGRVTEWGTRTLHFVAEDPERMKPAIDAWAEALPDALSPGLPPRRTKVNFARDMAWSFQRNFGVRPSG